jgi:hypothetical protein
MKSIYKFEETHSNEIKNEIDNILEKAFISICELQSLSLDHSLTLESIEEIEVLFNTNKINLESININDKYLMKYIQHLANFWDSPNFYQGNFISKGKSNLFNILKEKHIISNADPYSDFKKVIHKMQESWTASNQVYTMFKTHSIRKMYLK